MRARSHGEAAQQNRNANSNRIRMKSTAPARPQFKYESECTGGSCPTKGCGIANVRFCESGKTGFASATEAWTWSFGVESSFITDIIGKISGPIMLQFTERCTRRDAVTARNLSCWNSKPCRLQGHSRSELSRCPAEARQPPHNSIETEQHAPLSTRFASRPQYTRYHGTAVSMYNMAAPIPEAELQSLVSSTARFGASLSATRGMPRRATERCCRQGGASASFLLCWLEVWWPGWPRRACVSFKGSGGEGGSLLLCLRLETISWGWHISLDLPHDFVGKATL